RGTTNLHDPRCSFVGDLDAGSNAFGQGPHITGTLAQVKRGFIDGNRLIVAMATGSGTNGILAVDADTGDRTLISGAYSTVNVGTGTGLPLAFDVQHGPGGYNALANGSGFKIE